MRVGDTLVAETLAGKRNKRGVPVVGVVRDLIGLFSYMDLDALNRLMGEDDTYSSFSVRLDGAQRDALFRHLKEFPRVSTVASKSAMLANFRETSARNVLYFTTILTAFASVIAIGVVYNNARIALQERAWELASLRVLGFTRGEISFILLGELTLLTLVAIPAGLVIGRLLCWVMISEVQQDIFRVPLVVEPNTYALAATVVIVASFLSSLLVRSRLDHLDLVAVLKTQE